VRFHSAEYFVEQLRLLYEKGITFFYFSDDTFTIKKDRVIEICRKILEKDLKITWAAISRVDAVNEEILQWMRRAGCIQISYGLESGSKKIRKRLNKDIQPSQIKKAFRLTTRFGIMSRAYFIYGCPGETWATVQETIDLIHEIKPLSVIFYILDLFPGTKLYEDFKKKSSLREDIWLDRIEDIMYFETDPHLTQDLILAFGEKLRTTYYENLHRYVDAIDLIEDPEFYPLHADFCSRLGMTFSHGDYAATEAIRAKGQIAEKLFIKALEYAPDHRAFLGLGIVKQKTGRIDASIRILLEGIRHFPQSEDLHLCLGINYLNNKAYHRALSHFMKFQHSKRAIYYIAACHRAVGDFEKEAAFLERYRALP
jgi:radical SAM superfamily enzyme YgiQ (UPF0313 family)